MKSDHSVHCSPPAGSVDGHIVVEDAGGGLADLTTLSWQVALGSTLCYRSAGHSWLALNTSVLAGLSQRKAAWWALLRLPMYL